MKKFYGRGRRPKTGKMTKLEKIYSNHLEMLKRSGEILNYIYEPFSMKLADGCFYRPDFLVQFNDFELQIHETKGHWEDDALVKIKVASEKFPFRFFAVKKGRDGFDIREVGIENLTAEKKTEATNEGEQNGTI